MNYVYAKAPQYQSFWPRNYVPRIEAAPQKKTQCVHCHKRILCRYINKRWLCFDCAFARIVKARS